MQSVKTTGQSQIGSRVSERGVPVLDCGHIGSGMIYTEIYSDADGISRFRDADVSFYPTKFAAPGQALGRSDFRACEAGFLSVPSGWDSGWHNAPGDGFTILLKGKIEIEAGSGIVRNFLPGDVWRSTDVEGRGHISRAAGSEGAMVYMTSFVGSPSER
jgi:hypothetical protein